jgi:hypothetical protein
MSRLTVTSLSDGRLQLWVSDPSVLSSWQVSLDPAAAWSPLAAFSPGPPDSTAVSAGHSPDGRAQVWAQGYDNVLRTTWQRASAPDSGWLPWETFLNKPDITPPVIGQLSDGRMQAWASDRDFTIWSTWKVSTEANAPWSGWSEFSPGSLGVVSAAGSLSDGRVQLWARVFTKEGQGYDTSGVLMSCWKAAADPGSGWSPWQIPFAPELTSAAGGDTNAEVCAAGQLSNGSLQLWTVSSDGVLHSTWKESTVSGSPFTAWQSPFIPDPGSVDDVTVGRLADGSLKLWVLTTPGANGISTILTSQKSSTSPSASWTPWASIGTVG